MCQLSGFEIDRIEKNTQLFFFKRLNSHVNAVLYGEHSAGFDVPEIIIDRLSRIFDFHFYQSFLLEGRTPLDVLIIAPRGAFVNRDFCFR